MSVFYQQAVGPIPNPLTFAFRRWAMNLINYRLRECPLNMVGNTTYYFSQSGADGNNGLSTGSPKKTLAAAQTLLNGSSGNITILFKRGDMWNEAIGFSVTNKNNVVIGAYGTGEKPFFNRFTLQYAASGWTQIPTKDRWTRAETNQVMWFRETATRLNRIYKQVTSTALVESTPYSWYWAANVLHINPGTGISANSKTSEACPNNSDIGFLVTGSSDRVRLDSLRSDGHGMNGIGAGTTNFGLQNDLTTVAVMSNCEGYFSNVHNIIQLGGGGNVATGSGIATLVNCKAGYMEYIGAEIVYTGFSLHGGNEWVTYNCEATYGTLPHSDWVTATRTHKGGSMDNHNSGTLGEDPNLVLHWNLSQPNGPWSCEDWPYGGGGTVDAGSLSGIKAFFVNSEIETNDGIQPNLFSNNCAFINCVLKAQPINNAAETVTVFAPKYQYFINTTMDFDINAQVTGGLYSLMNVVAGGCLIFFYHSTVRIRNDLSAPIAFALEANGWFGSAGKCTGSEFKNSILDCELRGGPNYVGLNNIATQQRNNAYIGIASGQTDVRGYSNDPAPLLLDNHTWNKYIPEADNALVGAGETFTRVEYDARWNARRAGAPTIGPYESPYRNQGAFNRLFSIRRTPSSLKA